VPGRCLAIACSIVACLSCASTALADATPAVSLQASTQRLTSGQPVTLSGRADAVPPGTTVQLYASAYLYSGESVAEATTTAADGSFSFSATPDRNARFSARLPGGQSSPAVEVDVSGLTVTKVRALPLGRAQVTVVIFHPRDLAWSGARVRWSFASAGHGPATVPSSTAFALSPSVSVLKQSIALPAGPFSWTACFDAPNDHALLNPERPTGCSGRGYHGTGTLPVGSPSPGAVARAGAYLAARTGRTAFAVIDSQGRLSGAHVHRTFLAASVVKVMLLVGYLRRLDAMGQHQIDPYSNSFLYPMIHISDNNDATKCWSIVGDSGLYAVAAAAHMTDFSVYGLWGHALLSPADQARFFFEMDSLIPRQFDGYARFLLSTIDPSQSWAIPAVARPLGYRVFFKDGSEPTASGQLVHQVARLEGHGLTFSLAVMTDGDPTMQYGIDAIAGVTRVLLR
jgi:hypothetical protein